ncbi:MAG: hypothetical protein LBF88_08065, partial [Planctomycetaceae bacterium]|nr:hypothetical protein [Planctomycetaceae bacterium]
MVESRLIYADNSGSAIFNKFNTFEMTTMKNSMNQSKHPSKDLLKNFSVNSSVLKWAIRGGGGVFP